ncbi:MAG: hypothetical protein SOV26_00210 [Candidatus Onthovivens sp.]|nr:hypothetical protein [Candidatus Onthovivens sp.]
MKKPCRTSLFLLIFLLTSCSSNQNVDSNVGNTELENTIAEMRKGYKITGTIKKTTRYYTDSTYTYINEKEKEQITDYIFSFTYENTSSYIGVDRKIYYFDANNEKHLILDDNLFNDEGRVVIRTLGYDNEIYEDDVYESDSGNFVSYGASDLINPFLMINDGDFEKITDDTYSLNRNKLNLIMSSMFSLVDVVAFSNPFKANLFNTSDSIFDSIYALSSETYKTYTKMDYTICFIGNTYEVNCSINEIGTASAQNQLKPYENEEEKLALRTIFDKMDGQNLHIKRVDHTYYDNNPEVDHNETIELYYDGEKIFYHVYDSYYSTPNQVTASDFLLYDPLQNGGYLRAFARNSEGQRIRTNQYASIEGYLYEDYLPLISEINEAIFNYDASRDIYYLDEFMAIYCLYDGYFLPTIAISDAAFIDYLNKVEIKLKANGDIDYIKTGYYRDYMMYTQTSYYLLTYEYGPDVTMPYGIDEEL